MLDLPHAIAQIIPDQTLGTQNSVVVPNQEIKGNLADIIEGGAIRNNNLFHSFSEFNINELQKVYFSNPSEIENIVTRVTGNNISNILGTLGVNGNANLYLINPQGIYFGENAKLDISGSFFASTNESILFNNGLEFSATNPQTVPLLTINQPLGISTWLNPQTGTITNRSNLKVGQDLSLIAHNLDLQGQIQAQGHIVLKATDIVKIRDTITQPLIISAGENLLIEGNFLDIWALNHPQGGLFAHHDMILRSPKGIMMDTYFYTGGNFRLENINGEVGSGQSIDDPIIRASGDVDFDTYIGASLHILAGGSITANSIIISGADTTSSLQESIMLSDGITTVNIDGSAIPTLDLRAGTVAFGNLENTVAFPPSAFFDQNFNIVEPILLNNSITNADIKIGEIQFLDPFGSADVPPERLVFLTNQYQANPNLSGDIQLGTINLDSTNNQSLVVDSKGKINVTNFISNNLTNGHSGSINLLANNDIIFEPNGGILSRSINGNTGEINLNSKTAIIVQPSSIIAIQNISNNGTSNNINFNAPLISLNGNSNRNIEIQGTGGAININTNNLTINNGTQIISKTFNSGNGNNIIINADTINLNNGLISTLTNTNRNAGNIDIKTRILTIGNNGSIISQTNNQGQTGNVLIHGLDSLLLDRGSIEVAVFNTANGGNAQNLTINTKNLSAINGGQIFTSTRGIGNAGNILITAENLDFSGISADGIFSGLSSIVDTTGIGNAGKIEVFTNNLSLTGGAQIKNSSLGQGNTNLISINANNSLLIDGAVTIPNVPNKIAVSGIFSEIGSNAIGSGNLTNINTGILNVRNGGNISASTAGNGDAGNIIITAINSATFDGNPGSPFFPSGAFVGSLSGATGKGGNLTINTRNLNITNGAQLEALTESNYNAGNIKLNVTSDINIDGVNTGIFANTSAISTGNGGNIIIDPINVRISNGAGLFVNSEGTGIGGNIDLTSDNLFLNNGFISAETASNQGGNITLNIGKLLVLQGGSNITATAGTAGAGGNGGNINIVSPFIIAFPQTINKIIANAFTGKGGNINITTQAIFGSEYLNISASSQFGLDGSVIINTPDVDPTSGLIELATDIRDPNDQIVRGCAAAEGNSFTVTGRGGLPEDPTALIRGQSLFSDQRDFSQIFSNHNTVQSSAPILTENTTIQTATGWVINGQNSIELVATMSQENHPHQSFNCR